MLPFFPSWPTCAKPPLYLRLLQQFTPYSGALAATLFAVAIASLTDVLLIRQLQNVVDALRPQGISHGAEVGAAC
ncbi:hypothetical protein [Pseudoduganella plicata]|uniref:hypothetical protein n=1 Tax=Pseudoduganella plicata TaxID=321984 RepID=UPI001E2D5F88|nr:hypothetical protein [Pseudoduganella plicata]